MTRRILAALTLALIILGIGLFFLTWEAREREAIPETAGTSRSVIDKNLITIRNVTKATVAYTIKPANSSRPADRQEPHHISLSPLIYESGIFFHLAGKDRVERMTEF